MKSYLEKIKENKKYVAIFLMIMFVGIFLRVYNFHDWMRFSVDQSRDAEIVSLALENKADMPLLGPKANTTKFLLGPAFYYFSYASAKLFGNYPDKMAYPTLLFSILSLPLMFLFLREIFSRSISLALLGIMSVSYIFVANSHFSSNPNLIPFFLLLYLYAIARIFAGSKRIIFWGIFLGIGLGITIQLHTTLFVIMPITTLLFFIYIIRDKSAQYWKMIAAVFVMAIFLNVPQIVSEINTKGENAKNFIAGFQNNSKQDSKYGFGEKVLQISACQITANSHFISSMISDQQVDDNSRNANCSDIFVTPKGGSFSKLAYYGYVFMGSIFSLVGYVLLLRNFIKAEDLRRRNILGMVLLFNAISFIILIPVAKMMQTGYFIILFFIPFLLLGVIMEELQRRFKIKGLFIAIFIACIFAASSLYVDVAAATRHARGLEDNSRGSTLGQTELMSKFIISHSNNSTAIYFSGQDEIANRFYKPLNYFIHREGKGLAFVKENLSEEIKPSDSVRVFYILKNGNKKAINGNKISGLEIKDSQEFASQTIYLLGF